LAEECAQPVRNREPLGGALEELNDLLPGTGTSVIRDSRLAPRQQGTGSRAHQREALIDWLRCGE